MEHTIQWVRTGLSGSQARTIRESVLTIVFAALIGGIVVLLFVPSVKEAIWPVFNSFLSAL